MNKRRMNYGLLYFVLVTIAVIASTAWGPGKIHYPVFEGATRKIFAGEMAYGFPYDPAAESTATLWLYSPSCAMFFFSLFIFWPPLVGKILYLGVSAGVLATGLWAWMRKAGRDVSSRAMQVFWVLLSFELVGALQAYKIEVVTAGLALWAAWLLAEKHELAAGILVAMIVNWKFQGLPIAGLLLVAHSARARSWRFCGACFGAFVVYSLLPYAFLPTDYLNRSYQMWFASLGESLSDTWIHYHHIFGTFRKALHVEISLGVAKVIGALAGLGLAALVTSLALKERTRAVAWPASLQLACALGCAYIVVFSPMSQGPAYILWAPLLLLGACDAQDDHAKAPKLALGASFGLVSLVYSDLVPRAARAALRSLVVKPIGVIVLATSVVRRRLRLS